MTKKTKTPIKYTFAQDDNCHWYIIPVDKVNQFYDAVENEEWEIIEDHFRNTGDPSDYSFENPQKLKLNP